MVYERENRVFTHGHIYSIYVVYVIGFISTPQRGDEKYILAVTLQYSSNSSEMLLLVLRLMYAASLLANGEQILRD